MQDNTGVKVCVVLTVLAFIAEIIVYIGPGWVVMEYRHTDAPVTVEDTFDMRSNMSIEFGVWFYKVCKSYYDKPGKCQTRTNYSLSKVGLMGGITRTNSSLPEEELVQENDRTNSSLPGLVEGNTADYYWCKNMECYHSRYISECYTGLQRGGTQRSDKPITVDKQGPENSGQERSFICLTVDFAQQGRREIAIYVSFGIVFGLCGAICSFLYSFCSRRRKRLGKIACCSEILSSLLYWLAVVRVTPYVIQLRSLQKHEILDDHFGEDIRFTLPWCLVLGGISATLMDISAFLLLVIISREKKGNASFTRTEKVQSSRLSFVVPKGYTELALPYTGEDSTGHPEKATQN